MPRHILILKRGSIVMLLRKLNPKKGFCNGTLKGPSSLQKSSQNVNAVILFLSQELTWHPVIRTSHLFWDGDNFQLFCFCHHNQQTPEPNIRSCWNESKDCGLFSWTALCCFDKIKKSHKFENQNSTQSTARDTIGKWTTFYPTTLFLK